MKNNNFFIVTMMGVAVISGISFDMQASEHGKTAALLGTAALAAGTYYVTNTQTYQDWAKNRARLAQEREESDNPYFYAQELPTSSEGKSGEDKVKAFQERYEQQQKAYAAQQEEKVRPVVTTYKDTFPLMIKEDYQGKK